LVNLLRIDTIHVEDRQHENAKLVGGAKGMGRLTELAAQHVPLEHAPVNVAVSDIKT
jgi:hypothetical protein